VAGLKGPRPFEREAVQRIHTLARGVPRRINLLCDRALLGAYSTGKARVDRKVVDKAATEVFGKAPSAATAWVSHPGRAALVGSGALGAALLIGAIGLALQGDAPRPAAVAGVASAPRAAASTPALPKGSAPAASAALATAAASAASTASATAAIGASPISTASSPPAVAGATAADAPLGALIRTEKEAWRELAPAWNLAVGDSEPCQVAPRSDVLCFKGNGSLALIRQLGRPGILTLRPTEGKADDKPGYALLTGLTGQTATLRMQGVSHTVSLESLARAWRGEFATYWKAPAGYRDKLVEGNTGPVVDWLAARLAKLQGETPPADKQVFNAALKAKVYAFQFAQELKPDGVAGPETFMLLSRATGVDEPRLQTEE
jgi:general secretion pathway protein A